MGKLKRKNKKEKRHLASLVSDRMSTNKNSKETIPVKYEFMGSLRRTAIDVPPRLNQLRKKLAKSFPDFAESFEDRNKVLHLKYTDDEGEEITITTNDELQAAYRLAHASGKVLRFVVPSMEEKDATQ